MKNYPNGEAPRLGDVVAMQITLSGKSHPLHVAGTIGVVSSLRDGNTQVTIYRDVDDQFGQTASVCPTNLHLIRRAN